MLREIPHWQVHVSIKDGSELNLRTENLRCMNPCAANKAKKRKFLTYKSLQKMRDKRQRQMADTT